MLADGTRGGLAHCTLPEGGVSRAVVHRTVEELWYCVAGRGEVWRGREAEEATVPVHEGTSLSIPVGVGFQFRNTGAGPLCFIIVSMPRWPGPQEVVPIQDHWVAGAEG